MTAIALTIAGSDSGGGAGIQADLKTFSALGVFGASVITAVTAQNTQGVTAIEDLSPGIVAAQIDAVLSDLDVGAIKIGMVSRTETIRIIAERLRAHGRLAVVDPVMVATSGDRLLREEAIAALCAELLPLALLATPNLHEAALLTGRAQAPDEAEMAHQASAILAMGARAVLVKGGHGAGDGQRRPSRHPRRDAAPRRAAHRNAQRPRHRVHPGGRHRRPSRPRAGAARGHRRGQDLPHRGAARGGRARCRQRPGPRHHFYRWWPATGEKA